MSEDEWEFVSNKRKGKFEKKKEQPVIIKDRKKDKCPQCEDVDNSTKNIELEAHNKSIKLANETAITVADEEMSRSNKNFPWAVSWVEIYCVIYRREYEKNYQTKYKEIMDNFTTMLYNKPYGERSSDICSYHSEFRYS
jgi:hypothetical protein